ncbi:unnamed protein product [Nyctereutes procyonoides]|uniref:MICOS complex subunit n=1 Tax=Nyctereutes procyonoides TaxID=34880 RepID=A0A811YU62_NYCPR|nr:unnamed protein product [Nyctereutes procyonoides]
MVAVRMGKLTPVPTAAPIYTAPPLQSKYIEEQPGRLQMGFGAYVFVKNGIMDTVQFGKDVYVYLKNPPRDFLPKIGVITVSGLAGLVSARKTTQASQLATLGAAVTGKKAYTTSEPIYEAVKSLWTKINKKESFPKPKEKSKKSESTSGATQFMPDPKLMDHGQSHPEDVDM